MKFCKTPKMMRQKLSSSKYKLGLREFLEKLFVILCKTICQCRGGA